jgi:hypothetical protein
MANQSKLELIASLGFDPPQDVRGRLSVADLFPVSKGRTGVYLLAFDDGTFYVGQATDVCRRFAQHRDSVGGIVGLTFRAVRKSALDETERGLIRAAEATGLPITNRVHVSNVLGVTDFDLVVPPSTQENWLASWPRPSAAPRASVAIPADAPARARTSQAFRRLQQRPQWKEVQRCLQTFCVGCLPYPALTQLSFWSVSCLPSTNRSSWPRFSAVNAGLMELLVVGWEIDSQGTWGFVNGAPSVILEEFGSIRAFQRKFRRITLDDSRQYRSAGGDQMQFHAASIGALTELLEQPAVRQSVAQLALRVMRSRPTIYSKFHCPDLADAMLAAVAS